MATLAAGSAGAFLEPGLLLFAGAIEPAALHSHTAVQILIVGSGELLLRDATGSEQSADAAIIPSGAAHAVRVTRPTFGVTAYLDPAGRTGTAARARIGCSSAGRDDARTWVRAARPAGPPTTSPASRSVCTPLSSAQAILDRPAHRAPHPVLVEVLEAFPDLVRGPLSVQHVADHVGYPPWLLESLFLEEYGLPYPAWRRWARLRHGITLLGEGASLADAARGAGFVDGPDFTRTCTAAFGVRPQDVAAVAADDASPRP